MPRSHFLNEFRLFCSDQKTEMKYGKNGVKRVNATLTFGIQKDKLDELNLYHFQRGNAVLTRASGSFKN